MKKGDLPISEKFYDKVVSLPIYPKLSLTNVKKKYNNQFIKYILLKAVKINNTNINKSIFALENNKKEVGFKITNIKIIKLI